jgi:signal transduction histidine kinase/ligand-binding sensor domain-containing protein
MGTKDGLNRFDGYSFKVFRHDPEDSTSLGDNFIRSIFIDENDTLYTGTRDGLYSYNSLAESFTRVHKTSEEVRDIKKDLKGNLWFIAGQTLFRINQNKKISQYPSRSFFPATSVCIDQEGKVWISTATGFLQLYDAVNNSFQSFNLFADSANSASRWIEKIYATSNHSILAGTSNYGVKLFNINDRNVTNLLTYGADKTAIFARDFIQASPTELWMATESGIFILNTQTGSLVNLRKQYENPYSVSDNAVYSLTKDKEGGIWAGSYFGGVNYYPRQYAPFEKIFPANNSYSLSGNAVREICEDRLGNIWIGTEDAGLNKMNKTGSFVQYLPSATGISYPNIHGLLARGDELWIGTFEHGLDIMDIKTGKVIRHYPDARQPSVLKSNFIVVLHQTRKGQVYIGTRQGLYVFDEDIKNFRAITAVPAESFIHSLLEANDGTLWIGTLGSGLFHYNPITNRAGNFKHIRNAAKAIPINSVTTIFESSNRTIWIGTEGGGLCRFNVRDSSFQTYTSREGFPSNTIFKILEDDKQNLWITTSKGLVSFNPASKKISVFTTANGLLSNQFNYNSGYKDSSGKMYFGSAKGLISFNPDSFIQNSFIPPVFITGLYINNKELLVQPGGGTLKKAISYTEEVELAHDQSSFSIDFAALSFTAPEMMEYMYIMVGLDKDWTYLKTNRKVYFTNLSPGTYKFKVKAANSSGKWSDKTAELKISILPPLWKSPLAYLFYLVLAGSLIYFLFRIYHDRQNEKTRRQIEFLEHEKEKEIYQAKIEFFTNVAHEIKTPLTLIKAPMEKIIKKAGHTAEIENNLKIMERNTDRLIELTNQLLDFRKIETNGFQLNFVQTNINELLVERYASFKPLAEQKTLVLNLDVPAEPLFADVDIDALQKILNNLFYNALTYCKSRVDIQLLPLAPTDGRFTLEVRNDGYLIPQEMKEKIFRPFYQLKETQNKGGSGIGLALAKSLTDLHQGEIYLEDVAGESQMNVFILKLPVSQNGHPSTAN